MGRRCITLRQSEKKFASLSVSSVGISIYCRERGEPCFNVQCRSINWSELVPRATRFEHLEHWKGPSYPL